jgi:isovaleryl-CoA dehydrogenase
VTTATLIDTDLDAGLTDEMQALRHAVHRFAQERIAPRAAAIDRDDAFPRDLWPELGAQGLLGITVPEADGGTGMGYLAHVIAMEEISRASGSVGLSYIAHSNLCINQLCLNGTVAQRQRYLPQLINGTHVGSLAMSEPEAGSDVIGMQLRAIEHADGFRLTGTKMWITNGPDADVVIVYAKTAPELHGRGITAFIVERGMPGFSVARHLDKLGMRGSSTGELHFQDCYVPRENVLGAVNGGVAVLMNGLDYERVVIAGGPLGLMAAALDVVLPYVQDRRQFGRPIGSFELMQGKLADMYANLFGSRAFVHAIARDCDRGHKTRRSAAACLMQASDRAVATTLEAIQSLGGNGYTNDYPTGRLLRDAKLYDIGAGTQEIRRMLIGRELMELA